MRFRRTLHALEHLIDKAPLVHGWPQHCQRQLCGLSPCDRFAILKLGAVRDKQAHLLGIDRQGVLAPEVGLVEVGQRNVEREIVEAKFHRLIADELNVDAHAGILVAESLQHRRQHGRHRRHSAKAKVACQIIFHDGDFFAHGVAIGEDAARPGGNPLTLGRQPVKALAASAQKNRHAKFEFKLLDSARQ